MTMTLLEWSLFAPKRRTHIRGFIDYALWALILAGTAGDELGQQPYCIVHVEDACLHAQTHRAKVHIFQLHQGQGGMPYFVMKHVLALTLAKQSEL